MGLNGIGQFLNVIQKAVSRNVKLSSDVENAGDLAGIFYMVQNHSSFAFCCFITYANHDMPTAQIIYIFRAWPYANLRATVPVF